MFMMDEKIQQKPICFPTYANAKLSERDKASLSAVDS